MKIIHIVLGRANPHRMNGVNRVVHNLATAQIAEGKEVTVWGITASANDPDDESVMRTYATQWFLPGRLEFGIHKELKDALKENKEAVFHLHGGFIPVFYSISALLYKLRAKQYLTPHGTYTEGAMQGNGKVKKLYFELLEKRLISRLNAVQCLGHCEASDLKKRHPKAVTTLIPNGQNWEELKSELQVIPSSGFIIGYCGRISRWQKGLDVLMEAFAYYRTELNGSGELHLIGDGEYSVAMKEHAQELNVRDKVVFHGKQFGEDKIQVLKQMDVFVHTSRNEGLPTAVIEAAALGIPCIVSEMTSMDKYIIDHQAGWALPSLDSKEVALIFQQAEEAYRAGTLAQLGENAKDLAKSAFDWNTIAQQTFSMYAA